MNEIQAMLDKVSPGAASLDSFSLKKVGFANSRQAESDSAVQDLTDSLGRAHRACSKPGSL